MELPKIIVVDVDGVLCNTKTYNRKGEAIYKDFKDLDWTAIKAFKTQGIPVILMSGDSFNEGIAKRRNIPFYLARNESDKITKLDTINKISKDYGQSLNRVAYIGDDLLDLPVLLEVGFPFCPKNSPIYLTYNCTVLSMPDNGILMALFEYFFSGLSTEEMLDIIKKIEELDIIEHGC